MSELTGDSEYGSPSSSPVLTLSFLPINEILTTQQSQFPTEEEVPLSGGVLEHGTSPEVQMAETVLPTYFQELLHLTFSTTNEFSTAQQSQFPFPEEEVPLSVRWGDSDTGSTSSSPSLPLTFSPTNEILTAQQSQFPIPEEEVHLSVRWGDAEYGSYGSTSSSPPTNEIPTAQQSPFPTPEENPLSGRVLEHGTSPEIQMAETILQTFKSPSAFPSQLRNFDGVPTWEHGSTSALPDIQMADTIITPTVEILTAPEDPFRILDLFSKEKSEYTMYCVPFYHAALSGDTDTASKICKRYPDIVRARITKEWETGLHIAAAAKNLSFVRMLVAQMTPADIALTSKNMDTALCYAAASGVVGIAEEMVERVVDLPLVRGRGGVTPLQMAAELGHRDMVNYLLPRTDLPDMLKQEDHIELFILLINTNLYDLALEMLIKYSTLAIARDKNEETALHVLARKPLSPKLYRDRGLLNWKRLKSSGFSIFSTTDALKLVRQLWKNVFLLVSDDSNIHELIRKPTPLLFVAAALGNVEFIKILLRFYPDLIWMTDDRNRSMFHLAVLFRQENIFRIIYEIGARKDLIAGHNDDKNNNMLHMAATLAPSHRLQTVSGAALQLQRELMWFQEVEKIVQPSYIEMKNDDDLTPKELFVAQHKELRIQGEKWMKRTAQFCMVVAALIATVMFAAAFNLPGGIMDNGTPNYLKKPTFLIFVISDSVSLFSSTTAILVFLTILTSRYKEEDFLHTLPIKLIIGLSTLFFSAVTMMIAFAASMFIVFNRKSHGVAFAISSMAAVTVTHYAVLHYNLFADIFSSTYKSSSIFHFQGKSIFAPKGVDLGQSPEVELNPDDYKADVLEEIIVEKGKGIE